MAKQTFTTGQVLTAAQMTSLQQTAMLGGDASAKVASYVLVAADAGTAISMSNGSATTITVNTGLFAAGDIVTIVNLGAGVCTITAGTATVATSGSLALAQNQGGVLRFTSASAAIFFQFATPASGDIEGVTAGTGISGGGTSGTVTITNSMATTIDAKGDLIVGTGADAFARLAVGTNGHTLVADSVEATGLKWAAPASPSVTFAGCSLKKSAAQSVSNATWTAITWNQENYDTDAFHDTSTNNTRITIPAGKGGKYLIASNLKNVANSSGSRLLKIQKNGADIFYGNWMSAVNGHSTITVASQVIALAVADYIEVNLYQDSGGALDVESGDGSTFTATYLGA